MLLDHFQLLNNQIKLDAGSSVSSLFQTTTFKLYKLKVNVMLQQTLFIPIFISIFLNTSLFSIDVNLKHNKILNESAYISSQCYTKTEDIKNKNLLHNPCYSCHTKNKEPNFSIKDDDLQMAYDFPTSALTNPWKNLFKDRTKQVEKISDEAILKYINSNNYSKNNQIILSNKLRNIPQSWDYNNNGKWDGYIPDCNFQFDEEGFDKDINNNYSGWRSFAYRPFLGTFWPTNGSTDDVIIRLDKVFMQDKIGKFNLEVYKLNLSIVESLIKQADVEIDLTDERKYGFDINQNGKLDMAKKIVFKWVQPKYNSQTYKISNFSMTYVGYAKKLLEENKYLIAPGLYPVGTEFLHSVRYIGLDKKDNIVMAPRMKELRYGKKISWKTYYELRNTGIEEIKEKDDFPDKVDKFLGNSEIGLYNALGWRYQGFIEDKQGELRPQSYEETYFCMGCHNNIGAIADSTFAFQRKLEGNHFRKGWYHWTQQGLKNITDKLLSNGDTEYVQYLKTNNAGDEFRQNQEVMKKFFIKDWERDTQNIQKDLVLKLENPNMYQKQYWKVKKSEIEKLKNDISHLILPSKKRAIMLNKAYKVIVDEQSYIYGRDGHIKPLINVHKEVESGQMTQLEKVSNE